MNDQIFRNIYTEKYFLVFLLSLSIDTCRTLDSDLFTLMVSFSITGVMPQRETPQIVKKKVRTFFLSLFISSSSVFKRTSSLPPAVADFSFIEHNLSFGCQKIYLVHSTGKIQFLVLVGYDMFRTFMPWFLVF